ncbi:MAG: BON domain-containing protein [Candidatus Hydrogenedentes bacterium]|nr:BON domain-containing protein [Candidatus Hydrogenedentota bacterium]
MQWLSKAAILFGIVGAALAANAQGALEGTKEAVTDTAITARIETLFAVNEHLSPFNINTTTNNGVVTLTGTVSDDVQKQLATDLAKTVDGVTDVKNELTVVGTVVSQRPPKTWRQRIDDASLKAAIRSNLLWNRELKGLNIGVECDGGSVTIFGVVGNEFAKQSIEKIVMDTRGVNAVTNNITVHAAQSVDPISTVTRAVSDDVVAARVKSNLLVNRYVTTRNLNVKVVDGLCILTGTVDTEAQREAAEKLAASISGVTQVQNDLKVYAPPAPTAPPPAP